MYVFMFDYNRDISPLEKTIKKNFSFSFENKYGTYFV